MPDHTVSVIMWGDCNYCCAKSWKCRDRAWRTLRTWFGMFVYCSDRCQTLDQ